jgi:hypothetical protein
MATRLNRKRYTIATKALNNMIATEKTGAARRLRAIELLLGLYERHDRYEERRAQVQARKDAGLPELPAEAETDVGPGAGTETAPASAEAKALEFLEGIKARKGSGE